MKLLLFSLSLTCVTLFGSEKRAHKKGNPQKDTPASMHYRTSGGKYQRVVAEEVDPTRTAMNQQIRATQDVLKKNMQILGAQRRQIKNLNSRDAKKNSKDIIDRACEDIKEEINKFQARIATIIDAIE